MVEGWGGESQFVAIGTKCDLGPLRRRAQPPFTAAPKVMQPEEIIRPANGNEAAVGTETEDLLIPLQDHLAHGLGGGQVPDHVLNLSVSSRFSPFWRIAVGALPIDDSQPPAVTAEPSQS